jgi:hypothetical protein
MIACFSAHRADDLFLSESRACSLLNPVSRQARALPASASLFLSFLRPDMIQIKDVSNYADRFFLF